MVVIVTMQGPHVPSKRFCKLLRVSCDFFWRRLVAMRSKQSHHRAISSHLPWEISLLWRRASCKQLFPETTFHTTIFAQWRYLPEALRKPVRWQYAQLTTSEGQFLIRVARVAPLHVCSSLLASDVSQRLCSSHWQQGSQRDAIFFHFAIQPALLLLLLSERFRQKLLAKLLPQKRG